MRVSGALSPQTSSSEKEYSQEAAACNLCAAVRNLSSGLSSPEDSLESDRDCRERFFPPEDCSDDNEWEGEELLPTTEEEDLSDDSAYQERGVACWPRPPHQLPDDAWRWPPLKMALAPRPEEAEQREEDDSDSLDNAKCSLLSLPRVEDPDKEAILFVINLCGECTMTLFLGLKPFLWGLGMVVRLVGVSRATPPPMPLLFLAT